MPVRIPNVRWQNKHNYRIQVIHGKSKYANIPNQITLHSLTSAWLMFYLNYTWYYITLNTSNHLLHPISKFIVKWTSDRLNEWVSICVQSFPSGFQIDVSSQYIHVIQSAQQFRILLEKWQMKIKSVGIKNRISCQLHIKIRWKAISHCIHWNRLKSLNIQTCIEIYISMWCVMFHVWFMMCVWERVLYNQIYLEF